MTIDDVRSRFIKHFDGTTGNVYASPGRINLIGEHTDYNNGFVFPGAVEQGMIAEIKPNGTRIVRAYSIDLKDYVEFSLDDEKGPKATWARYIFGVCREMMALGVPVEGFNTAFAGDVPLGAGMSSSAALESCFAFACNDLWGDNKIEKMELARVGQRTEHKYVGCNCGIMDQFISALAEKDCAMLLDCRSQEPKSIPISDPSVSVLIANSNVKHALTGSEYPERRASCEEAARRLGCELLRDVSMETLLANKDKLIDEANGDRLFRRARHVVGEDARTLKMADALVVGDWKTVGEQMYASHDSLRDDFEVSCPEIDVLVEIARSIGPEGGVIGSRITGGGFGGCTVSLVKTDKVDEITRKYEEEYEKKTGIKPTIFSTRPAEGARVL
ncbi:MAG: galactokinase [Bacteroidaceae bacterium]|nr:galactokinase [Bacteroidaceae bacterium]